MGNCTGYCTGCKEDGTTAAGRYDANQVRNSYKEKDMILSEGFGGARDSYHRGQGQDYYQPEGGYPGYSNGV